MTTSARRTTSPRKNPEKLKELQAVFLKEAERNHVLPIDDRRSERFNPEIAGRPDLLDGRKSLTVYPGMIGMMENAFINVKGRHHTITAEVEIPEDKTNGVIIAQAGYFGGWTLYMKDGKPRHEYNCFALERTNIGGDAALAPGKHTISYEFIPDAAKPGTGGKSILSVDGKKVAEGADPQDAALRLLRRRRRGRRHRRRDQRLTRLPTRPAQHLHRKDRKGDGGAEMTPARPTASARRTRSSPIDI